MSWCSYCDQKNEKGGRIGTQLRTDHSINERHWYFENGYLKSHFPGRTKMENEAATIPQYNKETPPVICQRCGFVVEDPNQDFEIAADNSRMHRLIRCFELVKVELDTYQKRFGVEDTTEKQNAAFNRGFRGSRPLGGADLDDEAGLNDPKRKKK
jgi:hypothetical protein